MKRLAVALIALAASTAANSATTISFGTPSGNLGNSHVYTSGALTVTAKGFTAANAATALYGKNAGGDEVGLGLANDPSGDNEIYYGMGYVQLDVSALFGLVSSITFSTNSTTEGEQWSIFGSNVSGSYSGAALLSGTNENTATLPNFDTNKYKYYDFVSTSQSGGKNFLITGLTMTPVPEPATWAMMLLGFGGIGMAMRRGRRRPRTLMQLV